MGSGSKGVYSSGSSGSGSQPYAPSYHVINDMLENDKADTDIYNPTRGYFSNPTATVLSDAIEGDRIMFNGNRAENSLTYVMDMDGNIIFGKRCNPNDPSKRAPHPTLIGGKDPQVQCAGIIKFYKGRIVSVDDRSGHFRPNNKSLEKVNAALQALYDTNPSVFDKNSIWRKKK